MFIHPRCPCTQASLAELERLLAQAPVQIDVTIACLLPPGANAEWKASPLVRRAMKLPGARVVFDFDGESSRAFGVTTSGEALLYDPNGRLVFQGGLTAARGHEGDNPGKDAILAHLGGERATQKGPAFGCSLHAGRPRREANHVE